MNACPDLLCVKLLADLPLRCPKCGASGVVVLAGVVCRSCDTLYPERNGTVDFIPRRSQAPALPGAEALTSRILAALNLPPQARGEIDQAVDATRDRTGIGYIDAEICTLGLRFGEEERAPAAPTPEPGASIIVTRHYIGSSLPTGSVVFRSFRMRTTGALRGLTTGLGYRWEHTSGPRRLAGRLRDRLGLGATAPHGFTAIPIAALEAGREITLPLELRTPGRPGRYDLHVFPVGATGEGLTATIEIGGAQREPVPVGEPIVDYGEDHLRGVAFVERHLPAQRAAILEVAAGVNPHMLSAAGKGHLVVAADVCSNQMQIGAIFSRYNLPPEMQSNMAFVSCDATNAPFAPGAFDCAVMFSALHHFPDPSGFLRDLARLVRPGGVIAILCEPCSPELAAVSEAYLRDLTAGINEQMFAVEEYRDIFAAAGLQEIALCNDHGSLKAVLRN